LPTDRLFTSIISYKWKITYLPTVRLRTKIFAYRSITYKYYCAQMKN